MKDSKTMIELMVKRDELTNRFHKIVGHCTKKHIIYIMSSYQSIKDFEEMVETQEKKER